MVNIINQEQSKKDINNIDLDELISLYLSIERLKNHKYIIKQYVGGEMESLAVVSRTVEERIKKEIDKDFSGFMKIIKTGNFE